MFTLARSELLSTFFPTWLWQGREWSKWRIPKYDNYWINAHSHPVLSTYYPPSAITAAMCSSTKMLLDRAFSYLIMLVCLHTLLFFCGWYKLISTFSSPLIALFGAITFTFQASHLRQQPCIIYTLSWFPWMIYGLISHSILISSVSIGMIILAGYYPLAIFLLPISLVFGQWLPIGIGLLIGLPQLIPFLKYLPKTIRGKVSAPSDSPTEKQFYFGLTPLVILFLNFKLIYLILLIPLLSFLFKSNLFRVPQRAMILSCYGAIYFSLVAMQGLSSNQLILLILIQSFDLYINNRNVLPHRPYVELWEKPSRAFNTKLTRFLECNLMDGKVSGLPYPLFTGHINNLRTIGYCGSMQNNLMWKWRKSFRHDPFIDGVKEDDLTRFRVKYAYSVKRLSWPTTSVRNLYKNPNYCS